MDDDALLLVGIGALIWWGYTQGAGSMLETGAETLEAAVEGWANVNEGSTWVPVINATESGYGIPTNLLARQAYQESHFRASIIDGTQASPAGALGILQLEPAYFSSVTVPVPFTTSDTTNQISQAGQEMARLYGVYSDWGLALAAYNWGEGNVNAWLAAGSSPGAMPTETQNYVAQILTDVPVPSRLAA